MVQLVPASSIVDAASSSGYFLVEYYTADANGGSTGEYKAKSFQLK